MAFFYDASIQQVATRFDGEYFFFVRTKVFVKQPKIIFHFHQLNITHHFKMQLIKK